MDIRLVTLGFVGPQGAGKDFASKTVESIWPDVIHLRKAIADPLKAKVEQLYGIDVSARTPEVRELLQRHGAEGRDSHGELYWLNRARQVCLETLEQHALQPGATVAIHHPDVRLRCEAEALKMRSFYGAPNERCYLIAIDAPLKLRDQRLRARAEGEELSHETDPTETEWRDISVHFRTNNNGSPTDLERRLRDIVGTIQVWLSLPRAS